MHGKFYIHRDLKPENFLIGLGKNEGTLHLIDYGLAKKYIEPSTGHHIEFKERLKFVGALRYASLNAHLGHELGRKDDLESIGFILIYLMRGTLPWQGKSASKTREELERSISKKKNETSIPSLCKDLPGTTHIPLINFRRV